MHPVSDTLPYKFNCDKLVEPTNNNYEKSSLPDVFDRVARISVRVGVCVNSVQKGLVDGDSPTFEISLNNFKGIQNVSEMSIVFETGKSLVTLENKDIDTVSNMLGNIKNYNALRVDFFKYGELRLRDYFYLEEMRDMGEDFYNVDKYDKGVFTLMSDP